MKKLYGIAILVLGVLIGGLAVWYLLPGPAEEGQQNEEQKILYYRNPMNPVVTSPTPMKDPMGMDYIPVYADEGKPKGERKVLYYRNPMNPEVTSPVPMKDSMGMDYIPVYEDEALPSPGTVRISPEKIQMIGVRSEQATARRLDRVIRTGGPGGPGREQGFRNQHKGPGLDRQAPCQRYQKFFGKGGHALRALQPRPHN